MANCVDCGKKIKNVFIRCYECHEKLKEREQRRVRESLPPVDLDWDGLNVCSQCGDQYTTDDICSSCSRQNWIDKHG